MTSEELAATGLSPIGEEIHDSGSRAEGEVRSEEKCGGEEDLVDVDANPNELVTAKSTKSYPPAFVFGESKVTSDLIKEYEAVEFFPIGDARAPSDEQIPTPEANEVVVFQDFFTCGLMFLCDPIPPSVLEKFSGRSISYVTTPSEIISYYSLNHSIWSLSDNKESSR
jgi:hypothetical protein